MQINIVNKSIGNINIKVWKNAYEFYYPCEDPSECTDYVVDIPAGRYKLESYGASGGHYNDYISAFQDPYNNNLCTEAYVQRYKGNAKCQKYSSMGGSGGYVSGIITLTNTTRAYIMIGGQGQYKSSNVSIADQFAKENMIPGGYGGGGYGVKYYSPSAPGAASGGGRTALMINEDDIFHSILVAGAGGGTDNSYGTYGKADDGRGGSGGNLIGQGWWINGNYNGSYIANSSNFFTYGSGESAAKTTSYSPNGVQHASAAYDRAGAGSGWFGGFASHEGNSGAGGGTSFALTEGALIPDEMSVRDSFYQNEVVGHYNFSLSCEYVLSSVVHSPGIWVGNGMFRITDLSIIIPTCKMIYYQSLSFTYFSVFILMYSQ